MRTVFIGGTKRGYLTLKALTDAEANIVGIISLLQDKHEIERYEEHIQLLASDLRIPLYETKWMKDRSYEKIIAQEFNPDIVFVVGCRILIPPEIYQIPPLGTLAVHDSLLPEYRGFAPLNWSIINGESKTGVSLFYLNESMDGGDLVLQKSVSIDPDEDAPKVYERVCSATVDLVLEAYTLFKKDRVSRISQDYSVGSFACSRTPQDGWIDWNKSTTDIYNQIRALTYPYPGAFTFLNFKRLIIWKAKPVNNPPMYKGRIPGRIINVSQKEGYVDVLSGDGVIRIYEIQLEEQEITKATDVIKSVKSTLGLQISDLLNHIQSLEQQIIQLQQHNEK